MKGTSQFNDLSAVCKLYRLVMYVYKKGKSSHTNNIDQLFYNPAVTLIYQV